MIDINSDKNISLNLLRYSVIDVSSSCHGIVLFYH